MLAARQHCDIRRPRQALDLIGDLLHQTLLDLKPVGELVRDPRELREAKHLIARDVADGDITPEWQQMMLADRPDAYARYGDHLAGAKAFEESIGVSGVILDELAPPPGPAARCVLQTWPVRILTDRLEQLASQALQPFEIYRWSRYLCIWTDNRYPRSWTVRMHRVVAVLLMLTG